jgi:hypothetical protein
MAIPESPVATPPGPATSLRDRRRMSSRPLRYGLAISALLHLLVLFLYQPFVGVPGGSTLPPSGEPSAPVETGLQLMALRELPAGAEAPEPPVEPLREEEPEEEADEPRPMVPSQPAAPDAAGGGGAPQEAATPGEPARRSAAELLRPGTLDPALFGDMELPPLSEEERYRLQLAGRLEAWQDSVRTEMERAARATDWTYTDEEGNRWGVSPGRIHLGKFSLPLPLGFATPPGLRDEIERRGWESAEIRRGAIEQDLYQTQQERIREIRARREAERRDTLPPGGGR